MAGEDLYSALAGLNVSPAETGWGMGTQVLGATLPALMNPYGSTGSNLGIALGGALLQGLLGYQAKQQAVEDSLTANRFGLQMLEAATPAARLAIAESAPDMDIQSKLLGLNTRLSAQSLLTKALVDQEIAKKTGLAEFELGELGTKLHERELADAIAKQEAMTSGFGARQLLADELLRGRAIERKGLSREDVKIPSPVWNKAVSQNATSNFALDIASDIDAYKSTPEFLASRSLSAFGDAQTKERLANLASQVLQSRSGTAASENERAILLRITQGDYTAVSPDTVTKILKRFAADEKSIAADTIEAATQQPEDFITELRASVKEGRKTRFEPRVPSYVMDQSSASPLEETPSPSVEQRKAELRRQIAEKKALLAQRGK